MLAAITLYPGFTALDAIGPYQVVSQLPDVEVVFTAVHAGPLRDDTALTVQVERTLSDLPRPDIVIVPGGMATRRLLAGDPLVDWLRDVHPHTQWTTSVCTGSLLLAAAGILDGCDAATTHWLAAPWLERSGVPYTAERVVRRGRVITAAGVSSGIDMALVLAAEIAGPTVAQAIQLGIEYDPQPPFDAGAPAKAPAEVTALVRELMGAAEARAVAGA